ncbi:TDP-N-acetylfucosamine:lipid II N-acetylfucosaminyltransferase family protein [Aeromonas allosaccharophila]
MKNKILHIGVDGGFIKSFINFVKEEFDFNAHYFLITSCNKGESVYPNVKLAPRTIISRLKHYVEATVRMHQARKIIFHGIFDTKLVFILFLMPWLLKKSCWVLWGGDLYIYRLGDKNWKWRVAEYFRRPVIKKFQVITTTVPGDYELTKDWYSTKGKFIQNLMYKSHVYRRLNNIGISEKMNGDIFIQVGNSSDPSNNHIEILELISKKRDLSIKVFCPLSYGSDVHKDFVIQKGKELLGDRFIPLTELMSFDDYNNHMASIDIAIFNHDRQQAMGNIIGLVSLGKKVVLKNSVTPYKFFSDLGISIYTLDDENLFEPMDADQAKVNINRAKSYFTSERLKMNWMEVFDEK